MHSLYADRNSVFFSKSEQLISGEGKEGHQNKTGGRIGIFCENNVERNTYSRPKSN